MTFQPEKNIKVKSDLPGVSIDAHQSQTVFLRYSGNLQIPLAEGDDGGDDCIIVATSRPWGRKVVCWVVVGLNRVPEIPSYETTNTNEVFDGAASGVSEPKIISVGHETSVGWHAIISGRYEYMLLKAPKETDGYKGMKAFHLQGEAELEVTPDKIKPTF